MPVPLCPKSALPKREWWAGFVLGPTARSAAPAEPTAQSVQTLMRYIHNRTTIATSPVLGRQRNTCTLHMFDNALQYALCMLHVVNTNLQIHDLLPNALQYALCKLHVVNTNIQIHDLLRALCCAQLGPTGDQKEGRGPKGCPRGHWERARVLAQPSATIRYPCAKAALHARK